MELKLSSKAVKEFKALSKSQQNRFIGAFEKLESDPYNLSKELHVKKITDGRFSLWVGNYRAIYSIYKELIMVTVIRHRKDAYR